MNEYEKSAIIGFWRGGATLKEIYYITGIYPDEIKKAIKERQIICDVQSNNDKTIQNKIKVQKSNQKIWREKLRQHNGS